MTGNSTRDDVETHPNPEPSDSPTTSPDITGVASGRRKPQSLLAATGSIAVATLVSRITGFLKQLLILTLLGASVASSFTVAHQIPNMISELVLGAVLTSIVVPVLVRAEREDPDGGEAFVRRLFTAALVLLGTATVLAVAAAPVLTTHVFLDESGKVSTSLTTALSYLLLPAIMFYGLSGLFTGILNTRQVFKPGAWAPVCNNLVVLTVLVIYYLMPGEITLDPVRMSDPKLLVLGIGVLLGVVTQAMCLVPALRREGINLRPLWGLDDRLRQFGGMAAAIVLYVLISQAGMVFATRVSSGADEAGPAIYNNAWLLLQLPYGVLGVTVLTAIMPRLSRNAAADDTPAVVDDLSVATRLTMISLIPIVTFLTIAGSQVGAALYGYGNFGGSNAERLGQAVSWSAFTLIPYALVLIHLRVFYAREQAWTPTWIILGITAVKIGLSALAPVVAADDEQVVLLLGAATGVAFTVGAFIGGYLLHRTLGNLQMANVGRTVWHVVLASLAGAVVVLVTDRLLQLDVLADRFGGIGSLVRVGLNGVLMVLVALVGMYLLKVPEILAIEAAVRRKVAALRGTAPVEEAPAEPETGTTSDEAPVPAPVPRPRYAESDAEKTVILPRIDYGEYGVGPYDAITEVMPAIRDVPGRSNAHGQLPYPDQQQVRSGSRRPRFFAAPSGDPRLHTGSGRVDNEGVRVSDDHAAGKSTIDAAARQKSADKDGKRPPRDPNLDTGVIPVGSPQLPPVRVAGPASQPRRPMRGPDLIAGASVAGGRYRLLAPHGGARGLRFWQALDVKLDREVALTFVDAEQRAADGTGPDSPQAVLSRTLRLGRINSPGLARVLDVVRGSSGGIVVSEWTPGRSLKEMSTTEPSPIGAARAIRALAAAAEASHRAGSALSIDHPDRIRISVAGDAVLAFPATFSDSDAMSDVRGLGASLYGLITGRWPLGEPSAPGGAPVAHHSGATVGGMPEPDRKDGVPVEPRVLRPDVPFEISAVAVRALSEDGGIRTAATVQHILDQASVVDQKTEMIPALRIGQRAAAAETHALADPEALEQKKKHSQRMLIALAALGATTVLLLALIGWWIANLLAGDANDAPLTSQEFGLTPTAEAPAEDGAGDEQAEAAPPRPAASAPVSATSVSVFSPQGTPDSPATASQAIDGDPSTSWSTDAYFDPFPSLKNGVGLLFTLADASELSAVKVTTDTPGTVVEVRSAPSESTSLDQTQVIGSGTLASGETTIPVEADGQTSHVLVWITDLSSSGGSNKSSISEVEFEAAR
ncbi:murein biosynthesis integral membrane protein MurJ [Rhodococcus rhodochrous]|uniref:murein biosynthesis integral membrane protein MurJ n=1 Tax=Rhodococcus rhodochrous TaxID=1829 RepID=UPI001E62FACE|nr:murein biosynthesis integral membrane protein MurJ [Rhodococcus rhodochrous]MCD2097680.1 murein biosynthesis integral membrane protein MurJ [Rhodococcus rhodochrous]MCD2122019.1 murein biosynthesis integral membrane protein MurJ [Rhodococcus rhodochrous]MCQ4135032.1 murein biosynthesis integral membrane protein MurJ [Rhodococcus rhodochrous]MDJ0018883.1 murein biosynthesis integral membrane protein MurJ [Rhodococcus rhodochrous]